MKFINKLLDKINYKKDKIDVWTIIIVSAEDGVVLGDVCVLECENKKELLEEINYLKQNGQDLDYIRIYPPYSEVTLKEVGYNEKPNNIR